MVPDWEDPTSTPAATREGLESGAGVFCYGELGIDNLIRVPHLPSPEVAAFPASETYQIGGAAANTAVWLSRWGVRVKLAGNQVGEDEFGGLLLDRLSGWPTLDLRFVEQKSSIVTPFCRVLVTPDGERTFLVYWYPQTPKSPLKPGMLDSCGYLSLDLYGGEERLQAARTARVCNVRTVVGDVVWPDHPVLPLTDIATNSAAFIRQAFPGADLQQHARSLQAISRGMVVTTDGPGPIHVIDPDGSEFSVRPPQVRAVDATGAGDAFRAGLIFGLLCGWAAEKSVRFGAAAGAFSVQQDGAASNPASMEEVEDLAASL
jgi:sugar/nucleoside kinase (ribokinase family)